MTETLARIWRLLDDITEMDDLEEMRKEIVNVRDKVGDIFDEIELRVENISDILGQ